SSNTNVAWGRSFSVEGDCPYMDIEFRRYGDNAYYGIIRHQHTEGPPGTAYYTWVAGPGVQYDYLMGSFVHHWDDACSSYNHVMQWYTLGLAGNILSKNGGVPNESGCYRCNQAYASPWSPVEYIFGFVY
ncbi:MAG TPA: hypothetical protein VFO59_03725, partial [Dehalococcoidia bacterium]|nr:hypothetical protein [Dehalococcoidia bacterium]